MLVGCATEPSPEADEERVVTVTVESSDEFEDASTATETGSVSSEELDVERPDESVTDVVARVRSGVIRIEAETCEGKSVGTGFLVGPRHIATVEHVIAGARLILLKRAGKVVGKATVIGADTARDLALLRSDQVIDGHNFTLVDRKPQIGEEVLAIGFPFGLPLSVTSGLVSGLDRTIGIEGVNRRGLVQTDAAVTPW